MIYITQLIDMKSIYSLHPEMEIKSIYENQFASFLNSYWFKYNSFLLNAILNYVKFMKNWLSDILLNFKRHWYSKCMEPNVMKLSIDWVNSHLKIAFFVTIISKQRKLRLSDVSPNYVIGLELGISKVIPQHYAKYKLLSLCLIGKNGMEWIKLKGNNGGRREDLEK